MMPQIPPHPQSPHLPQSDPSHLDTPASSKDTTSSGDPTEGEGDKELDTQKVVDLSTPRPEQEVDQATPRRIVKYARVEGEGSGETIIGVEEDIDNTPKRSTGSYSRSGTSHTASSQSDSDSVQPPPIRSRRSSHSQSITPSSSDPTPSTSLPRRRSTQPRLHFSGLSEVHSSSAPPTTTASSSSSTTLPRRRTSHATLPTPSTSSLAPPRRSSVTSSTTTTPLPRRPTPQPVEPPTTMTPSTTPGLSSSSYSLPPNPTLSGVSLATPTTSGTSAATSVVKTGAASMAAAAKERKDKGKGRAVWSGSGEDLEGLEGRMGYSEPVDGEGGEEGWHPLGEKALAKRGYHSFLSFSHPWHLETRWTLQRELGQGAYGLVISAQDSLSGETIAIKMITRVFDKVILARRCLREITLLRHLNGHENITGLIDLDTVTEDFNEVYMFMEPMEADLHQIIRSGQQLTNSHIQYFLYQLLRGMKYIHSANVIHRDLKPGNILVNADCELKICDLGLARGYRPDPGEWDPNSMGPGGPLTEYVATRWYRAPEVMLSYKSYSTAIDVWSIGCILAELLGQKPIFKGKDYIDQLNLILEVVGTPDEATLIRIGSEKACAYIRSLPIHRKVPFASLYPNADPEAIDLLEKLLLFDPAKRITVKDALSHPFLAAYHDESDEPDCPAIFDKWEEVESLTTIDQFKVAIKKEVDEFRAEVRDVDEDWDPDAEEGGEQDEQSVEVLRQEEDSNASPKMDPKAFALHRDSMSGVTRREREGSLSGLSPVFHSGATTPATPQSAISEASFTNIPVRSRRSSGAAGALSDPFARRPMSMSFGVGMSAFTGMTPLNAAHPDGTQTMNRGRQGSRTSFSNEFAAMRGAKARTSSTTSGDGAFKPLLRGLSSLSVKDLHHAHPSGAGGPSSPPPMTVSPSDAPPSEVPLEFKTKKAKKAAEGQSLRGP